MSAFFSLILFFLCYLASLFLWIWACFFTDGVFLQIFASLLFAILSLLLLKRVLRFFAALGSRCSFYRALRRTARAHRWDCIKHHSAIAPFFKSYAGADVTVRSKRREVNIKFLPFQIYKKNLHIENDRRIILSTPWVFFGAGHRNGMRSSMKAPMTAEFFTQYRTVQLTFGKDTENPIWIIPPKCLRFTCLTANGSQMEHIDNGYVWNENAIFYEQRILISHIYELLTGEEEPVKRRRKL